MSKVCKHLKILMLNVQTFIGSYQIKSLHSRKPCRLFIFLACISVSTWNSKYYIMTVVFSSIQPVFGTIAV